MIILILLLGKIFDFYVLRHYNLVVFRFECESMCIDDMVGCYIESFYTIDTC